MKKQNQTITTTAKAGSTLQLHIVENDVNYDITINIEALTSNTALQRSLLFAARKAVRENKAIIKGTPVETGDAEIVVLDISEQAKTLFPVTAKNAKAETAKVTDGFTAEELATYTTLKRKVTAHANAAIRLQVSQEKAQDTAKALFKGKTAEKVWEAVMNSVTWE